MIVIVDYNKNATQALGQLLETLAMPYTISDCPEVIRQSDYLILPDGDSYQEVMAFLNETELSDVIKAYGRAGNPLLGIGMGMHVLFEGDTTTGFTSGLGLLAGLSESLPSDAYFPVPHQRETELLGLAEGSQLTQGLGAAKVSYDHRLTVDCDLELIQAVSQYSIKFPAIVQEKNIVGYQFLVEERSGAGGQALHNFIEKYKERGA